MTNHIQITGNIPRIQYTANGTQTHFEFPFAIFESANLKVYLNDTLQNNNTYSIETGTTNGAVNFTQAPASGTAITLCRNLNIKRTSDFQDGSALRASVLNDELDYQTACIQEVADNLNRSMVLPPYALGTDVNLTLPTPAAGKAIVWNTDGTNLENSTVSVNALESTIAGYKTAAETAATTATTKATEATSAAQTATSAANAVSLKANKDFSNLTEENARQLIGNRIWISELYDLSNSANVVISHNLNLTDTRKALAIPYLQITTASEGYAVGDIISHFSLCGMYYTPAGTLVSWSNYGNFLNLTTNTVTVPKLSDEGSVVIYNKSTGAYTRIYNWGAKVFVKIIY